jgi:hypothetical protein
MPFKNPDARRRYQREYMRRLRAEAKAKARAASEGQPCAKPKTS